jgi:hypothetical protein
MENNTNTKLIVFLDAIGRTILGEEAPEQDSEALAVKNPVVLHVVPDQSGRMSVQLLPLFFREFLASHDDDVTFKFKLNSITLSDIETLDFRLSAQYNQLFGKSSLFVPPQGGIVTPEKKSDRVINLFDAE